jgi:hypothetical protein
VSAPIDISEIAGPAGRRIGGAIGLAILAALALWVASYALGAFPWLGYAWLARSSFGAGPIGIIGENRAGTSLGISTFLFFKGQEIVIDYDAEVRAGSLWFYVYNPFDGELGDGVAHYVTESGAGEWTVPITRTAIYHITIEGSPTRGKGRGWDLSYTAWWGARPAR